MEHLGDITKISGTTVPMVHIITGGSPCQDLSIAGKRAGLAGERSGLFMEQIRIIKEMRNESKRQLCMLGADVDIRHVQPRYTIWENVYGAFSSNNGEDFRAVLEETVKVADKDAYVPGLAKGQRWASAGCIMGDGYSVAWRVHDAQYWGVPQRRRRLCVLADYGGATAPKILFELLGEAEYTEAHKTVTDFGEQSRSEVQPESEGLPWDTEQSAETRKGTSGTSEDSLGETSCAISFQERAGKPGGGKGILIQNERTGALSTLNNQSVFCIEGNGSRESHQGDGYKESDTMYTINTVEQHAVAYGISSYDSNAMKSPNPHSGIYEADTSRTLDLTGGSPACNQGGLAIVEGVDVYNQALTGDKTMSITGAATDSHHIPCVAYSQDAYDKFSENDKCASLKACGGTYGGGSEALVIQ